MRRIPLFVFAGCLLLGAGCFPFPQPTAAPAAPVASIRVANIGEYSILNLIARERGFFAANGLAVEMTEYDSGATSMGALLGGRADVAVAADFVGVRRMFDVRDLRIIAQASEHEVFRVVARRDKGVAVPADLKGKTIGVTLTTAGELYLGRFLKLNGVRPADVTVRDLTPAEMVSRLEAGQLDAVLIFEPHAYGLERRLGDGVVSWPAQGGQRALGIIYSTRAFVEQHPEALVRYLQALSDAQEFLTQHDAEARGILAEAMGYESAYVDATWARFRFGLTLSQDLIATLEDQGRWQMGRGLSGVGRLPNYLDFIWFAGLERVRPGAVTIVH